MNNLHYYSRQVLLMARKRKAAPKKQTTSKTVKVEVYDNSDASQDESHLSSSAPVNLDGVTVLINTVNRSAVQPSAPVTYNDIQNNIADLLSCHAKNPGDFACTGTLENSKIGSLPLIDIEGYGVLPLPANEFVLKDMLQKRNLGEFEVLNKDFGEAIDQALDEILPKLGLSIYHQYSSFISALCITKPRVMFEPKGIVSQSDCNPFAKILIRLPSIFDGGDSIIEYNSMPRIFSTRNSDHKDGLDIIAFYSDCSVKHKATTKGFRAFIIADLYWDGIGPSPTARRLSSNTERLAFLLNLLFENENKENRATNGEVKGMLLGIPIDDGFSSQTSRSLTVLIRNAINYDIVKRDSEGWSLFEGSIDKIQKAGNSFASLENRYDLRCHKYCFENVTDRVFPIDKLFRIFPDMCFIWTDKLIRSERWKRKPGYDNVFSSNALFIYRIL